MADNEVDTMLGSVDTVDSMAVEQDHNYLFIEEEKVVSQTCDSLVVVVLQQAKLQDPSATMDMEFLEAEASRICTNILTRTIEKLTETQLLVKEETEEADEIIEYNGDSSAKESFDLDEYIEHQEGDEIESVDQEADEITSSDQDILKLIIEKEIAVLEAGGASDETSSAPQTRKIKTYQCGVCGKVMSNHSSLYAHTKRHFGQWKQVYVNCKVCSRRMHRDSIPRHMGSHSRLRPYKCTQCALAFKQVHGLRRHIENHHSKQDSAIDEEMEGAGYDCEFCSERFKTKALVQQHKRANHEELLPYRCSRCSKTFLSSSALTWHHRKFHTGLPAPTKLESYPCDVCSFGQEKLDPVEFRTKREWMAHMTSSHPDERPYKCGLCDERYRHLSNLRIHEKQHLSEQGPITYHCEECDKSFTSNQSFKNHMERHNPKSKHLCDTCGGSYKTRSDLRIHVTRVHNRTKFACPTCGKMFHENYLVKNHMKTHLADSEKPFMCEVCSKGLVCRYDLKVHMQSHQWSAQTCEVCKKTFASEKSLKKHSTTHTGVKDFTCTICGKAFRLNKGLALHMRIHEDCRPFECTVCPKKFIDSSNLKRHFRQHTGERPYECAICKKLFTVSVTLKSHMRMHHPGEDMAT